MCSKKDKIKLTILMPCLNEKETLGTCIAKAKAWIDRYGIGAEVLVADNGSSDGSQEIARSLGARVVTVNQRGYGSALFHGTLAAKGEWIIMGDSDDSYDFSELDLFIQKLDQSFDLVMGNRFAGGIDPGAMPWKNKYIGNPILSSIGKVLFRCPVHDFHCGLRAFTKNAFLLMDLRTTGMEYASEMVIKATLYGLRICEVPTRLAKDGRTRPPHLRPWRDGWRHLRFMFLFSPRWLFLIPGVTLFLVCSLVYFSILISPVKVGNIVFDINTLLFSQAGVLLGFLIVMTGLLVRIIATKEGLLKENRFIERFVGTATPEIGGLIGLFFLITGFLGGIISTYRWAAVNFGQLAPDFLIRMVSLSTLLFSIGGILITSSLMVGFLSLQTKNKQ